MQKDYATYFVGLKILLRKGDEILFLKNQDGTKFDSPGGRIDYDEHKTPIELTLAREVREELGSDVKYKLGKPVFHFRRHLSKDLHIFACAYEAEYLSGEIQISEEHSGYVWIDPKKYHFKESEFANREEYLAFKEYFYLQL